METKCLSFLRKYQTQDSQIQNKKSVHASFVSLGGFIYKFNDSYIDQLHYIYIKVLLGTYSYAWFSD